MTFLKFFEKNVIFALKIYQFEQYKITYIPYKYRREGKGREISGRTISA